MQPAIDNLRRERDSCGIGFLADASGRASRSIVDGVLEEPPPCGATDHDAFQRTMRRVRGENCESSLIAAFSSV